MNILFLSISSLPHLSEHSISLDLIREIQKRGHAVYVVCAIERSENTDTYVSEECGCSVLRVKIGDNKQANIIKKGLTTVFLPQRYISAISTYYDKVKFDLVMYPTPPVTQAKTVQFLKKRDNSASYLMLKDIFPQNAVDLGIMSKTGPKGFLYRYFRKQEKRLYYISDYIGCMSAANEKYIIDHNPNIDRSKLEVCPNALEPIDMSCTKETRDNMREKYGIPLDKKVFVYGGNLGKPQGVPFIIDCLRAQKDNSNVFFLIVGSGTEYIKIESYLSESKQKNCRLMSKLPNDDYEAMIGSCDVGLVFLDNRFTIPNFPSRILSYMKAKLPILACTDLSTDLIDVIEEGGFGWWCKSDDVVGFNSIINDIFDLDDIEISKRGLKSFDYLQSHYTPIIAADTILRHFYS